MGSRIVYVQGTREDKLLAYNRKELNLGALAYSLCLRRLGIPDGCNVQVYDYGSSLACLLLDKNRCPLSIVGALQPMHCVAVFNDGLPDFVERGVYALRRLKVDIVIVRMELFRSVQEHCEQIDRSQKPRLMIGTSDSYFPSLMEFQNLRGEGGIPISILPRIDELLFFAFECVAGGDIVFHYPKKYFESKTENGRSCVYSRINGMKKEIPVREVPPSCGHLQRHWGTLGR